MRALAAPAATLCLLVIQASLAAQEFPYTIVVADRAPLRASANETNEPTTYLHGGTKLEVYRKDGNFLAVRPPEGCFSWVRASDVEATADAQVVRVVNGGSQAWVGHQGTDLRAISQVVLQPGEKLRVLGAVASPNNPAQAAWYQIAPPAGEFRFVLAQHATVDAPAPAAASPVQLTSWSTRPEDAAAAPPPVPQPTTTAPLTSALGLNMNVMPLVAQDPVAERLKQIDMQLAAMLAQPPSTWNTTALYAELQTLTATAPTPELRTQAQNLWWRVAKCQQVQQGYVQISSPPVAAPMPTGNVSASAVPPTASPVTQASYTAPINPATGQPLVQPQPETHTDLQPLVSRIKELAGNLSTNMQQQRTYTSTLRNRSASSTQLASADDTATHSALVPAVVEEATGGTGGSSTSAEAEAGGYAGTGWLMPLVNRSQLSRDSRSGVPPFALTDDDGNVKFLVTPTPGLSVSEYARKKVGIIGPVGQLPGLSNPHIAAQRVVVLDRHE